MTYSESLAERIRREFGDQWVTERKMFGGITFLLNGNICVGVWNTSLIARVGANQYGAALQRPFVQEFDVTGRAMKGWVLVEADGIDCDEQLRDWIQRAVEFVKTLPAK